MPPSLRSIYNYEVRSEAPTTSPVKVRMSAYRIAPEFFKVFGIRLIEGRSFEAGDPNGSIIVSRSLARLLWPAGSAVGRTMTFSDGRTFRVLGVTDEVRNPLLDPRSDEPEVYEPFVSADDTLRRGPALPDEDANITIRCPAECPPLDDVRAKLKAAASGLVVGAGKELRADFAAALERPRVGATIALVFAGVALLAVGAGLFAVFARVALQRQREYGIRLALGATPHDLWRAIHWNSLTISAVGIAAGGVLAWFVGRLLAAVQYDVRIADPVTWTVVIITIGVTAFAATWRPARQAMRVDPIALLRAE